jgi:hypothetical protein
MSNRTLVWTLAALAVVLVLVPLAGTLLMAGGTAGWAGMMGGGITDGGMAGMHAGGILWLVLTIVVIAALVALLVRGETKA